MELQQFINQKKENYQLFLDYIEDKSIDDKELMSYLDNLKNNSSKEEILEFFHLILNLSNNHHRNNSFTSKLQQIFLNFSTILKQTMSNDEMFNIFKQNNRILLFLIKNKIMNVDSEIFIKIKQEGNSYCHFFYPQIKNFLTCDEIEHIENELKKYNPSIFNNFERKQNEGENESIICSLIRNDDIEEFIKYINKNNISMESNIKTSIFETNESLIDENPTLIEYAAFFGSIQIFNYLKSNGCDLNGLARKFAIHSNNAEIFTIIEETQTDTIQMTNVRLAFSDFEESIKCHHNEIADYVRTSWLTNYSLGDSYVEYFIKYYNYHFFLSEIDHPMAFYYLYIHGHMTIVNEIVKKVGQEVDTEINNNDDESNNGNSCTVTNENNNNNDHIATNENNNNNDHIATNENNNNDAAVASDENNASNTNVNDDGVVKRFLGKIFDFFSMKDNDDSAVENVVEDTENEESVSNLKGPSKFDELLQKAANASDLRRLYYLLSKLDHIDRSYFQYNKNIKMLIIPPSIKRIESESFKGCSSLTTVILSPIESIEDSTFYGCYSLSYIDIPSTVTKLCNYAFQGCEDLKTISVPSTVQSIGKCCFGTCSKLYEFVIPSLVTTIQQKTFCFCTSLTEITIPNSVTTIESYSFEKCKNLSKIEIPSSVTTIGSNVFNSCTLLKEITIPSSVKSIGKYLFGDCHNLIHFSFPSSLEYPEGLFLNCYKLRNISIPSSMTKIEDKTFCFCNFIQKVEIPSSIVSIGKRAFSFCSSLREITIPESVELIDDFAFGSCQKLKNVVILSNVKKMGNKIFDSCSNLKKISIPSSLKNFDTNYLPESVKIIKT